jgi:hypothetical protein
MSRIDRQLDQILVRGDAPGADLGDDEVGGLHRDVESLRKASKMAADLPLSAAQDLHNELALRFAEHVRVRIQEGHLHSGHCRLPLRLGLHLLPLAMR